MINTAPNSPWKGFYPNVNPFGITERYGNTASMLDLYKKATEDDTSHTIKPLDREKANIEAEKGEILLTYKDTGLALHNIKGKPHSKGGTPLNVPDGSFIFSKDKSMGLTQEEIETYELGEYRKGGLVKNTPADVLKRNVDLKHNNKMIDFLKNSKNYAEKTTALKMLEKYQKTVGTIAALQESRKESQMPEFAQLTPPNQEVMEQEDRQEQYSKGGWVHLPKAQVGLQFKKPKKELSNFIPSPINFPTLQGVQSSMNRQIANTEPIVPTPKPIGMQSAVNRYMPESNYYPTQNQQVSTTSAPEGPEFNDDFSWIKPYDPTSKVLSMMGNLMQSPRSFYPSLALQTPYSIREQRFDAQPGVNAAIASAYASRKANMQYGSPQMQNNQLIDSQAIKMAQEYASGIDRANQAQATNVHNQNAQIANQALNMNNQARGQYVDKLNELYQNVSDTRNTIGATNLQLMGEGLNEKKNYDMQVDFMKRYHPWNRASKTTNKDISDLMNQFESIVAQHPGLDNQERYLLYKTLQQQYLKQTPNQLQELYNTMSPLMNQQ